jgi:hypothetical protein
MVELNVANTPNMTFGVNQADAVAPALEREPERLIAGLLTETLKLTP